MTRKLKAKRVDRAQAGTYLSKARGFRADAETMAALEGEFSGNGLAVLCVRGAIAYADALAVRAGEVKSASGEHLDAVDLLESVVRVASDADRAAVKALRYVLQRGGRGVVHGDACAAGRRGAGAGAVAAVQRLGRAPVRAARVGAQRHW